MRRWMKLALGFIVVVLVGMLALPLLINANTFRPLLETQLTTALGRQVHLGNLSLSLLTGSLVANDLSIADDPAFGQAPFLIAKKLKIGVQMKPLIIARQLHVRSFAVDSPEIRLTRSADGTWNFSSMGHAASQRNPQQQTAFPDLTVGLVTIQDGRAIVESLPAQGQPHVYQHLGLTVTNFAFAKSFPFALTASVPGDGTIALAGEAGPINQQDAATTALQAQLTVKHLDPVAAGFLEPSTGLSMLADIDAHASSDGATLTSAGSIHAQRLVLMPGGAPTPQPVELTYAVTHTLKSNSGQVQDLAIKTGDVAAHLSGSYQLPADAPRVNLTLSGQSLPIDQLQALLPAVGVKLPHGSVLQGGTLTTTLAITGSLKDLTIAGPVEMDNTRLAGFNLGSKLQGMAALGGVQSGDATSIQTMRTTMQVTNAGVQTDNLYVLLPALGEATGSGSIAPGGALNYRLTVKLQTTKGIGQAGVGLLSAISGVAGDAASVLAAKGVPMTITGTTSDPSISIDLKSVLQKDLGKSLFGSKGQQQNPLGALGALFGNKNP